MGPDGVLNVMSAEETKTYFHLFVSAVYFTPILGALLSDIWLGKFKTIVIFSIINCLGLFALVVDDTRLGLSTGLILIAIGSGFIKPCVSANVGDQFGKSNKHLLEKVYGWFYFSINFGAFFSYMLIPELLDKYGARVAFSVPAASMLLATIAFWMGRKKFVHVPAAGIGFIKETFSGEGIKAIGKLSIIYAFLAMFWALFDQGDSSWIIQADKMNRHWLGHEWLPPQIMAANPLMIMILIPIFSYAIYPAINKVFRLTPLRKISIGLFVAALAFVIPAWIETQISEVRYNDVPIGDIVLYGTSTNDLRIDFDSDAANGAAVGALLKAIQFNNSSEDPNTTSRTARITLYDGSGSSDDNDVTITVANSNDVPVISNVNVDNRNYNGGYLLIHRQANFTDNDTLSIDTNSDGDADITTGIGSRDKPSIGWLVLACLIITSAEVMVSITCLEFSYTQAPKKMKSLIMAMAPVSLQVPAISGSL
jgi:dipeptide/tripeptide permease